MFNNYLKVAVWRGASANLGACQNSELASELSLEPWVLNSTLQASDIQDWSRKN